MSKRTRNILKDLDTTKKLVAKKSEKVKQLEKEIAYLEMREATGTANKATLSELIERQYKLPKNDIGQVITAGGAIYGE